MMAAMAAACAAVQLAAMPTEKETRRAEPVVRKLLEPERKALRSGKKTRSEVANAAMKLAAEADTEAAKLLLMKGAFVLYVQDGNLAKAAEAMNAIKAAIPDMPPKSVTNMIEAALLGASKKGERAQLYKLLDEAKVDIASKGPVSHLFPGWSLLNSEVKPELVSHRGQDLVLRMHPKDQKTPVVLKRTVKLSNKNPCLFLKVSSFDGKSDFVLSVRVNGKDVMPDKIVCTSDLEPWEDLVVPLFDWRGDSVEIEIVTRANGWWCEWSHFVRIEIAEGSGQETCGLAGVKNGTETVNGYTWSYFVKNGEATVTAAVSPSPKGDITIPATLGGVKVTGLGKNLFDHCKEVTSVTIPEGVTSIGQGAFNFCYGLKSVTIPSSVKTIGDWAFSACFRLQTVTMPESLEYIGTGGFINCRSFKMVKIPAKLAVIGGAAFAYCTGLKEFDVDAENETFTARDGILYSKDMSTLVSVPNVSTIARIPSSVTKIGASAFQGRDRLETLTIPEGVTIIDRGAFHDCGRLGSMAVPAGVAKIEGGAFYNCGALTEVTMLGERPETPKDIFNKNCGKLKAIHVPANAKSWAGMKEWQGIPLVFDGENREATEKALNNGNATSPTPSTNGLWTVKQYNSTSPIPSLVEAKELVGKASKVAEQTYQTLSFENNYKRWGCFPHVEFPGTTAGKDADYFAIVATGDIYVPNEGDWTFACLNDDGVSFTMSGNGLSDTFENDGLGGIFRAPWLHTVHFPRAGISSVTCLFFENRGIAGLEYSVARGSHSRFDSSVFKLVGDPESGIVMVGDAKDVDCQVQATEKARTAAPNVEYKFSYKLEDGNAIITGIDPKPVGTLVIPDKIDGHKVTNISGGRGYNDDSPFWSGCEQMTKVVLPAGLEKSEAFCNCKSLSSIEISRSNKNFASHDGALYTKDFSTLLAYPKTLESVKLSPKTRKIGACAFRGCALKTANLPKGIMEVAPWNLCECPDLELIEFPKSLKYLGQCAACGSGKLKKIVFNGDAPQIGLAQFSWGKQVVFTGAPADLVVEVRKGTKGWKSPGSRELPERWPTNQDESRPIRYIK